MILWANEGTRVHISRVFRAPAERVFRAFTDPEELKYWAWGKQGKNPERYEVDLRIGGRYAMYIRLSDNDDPWIKGHWHTNVIGMTGIYADIAPNRRLIYTLHWDAPVGYNEKRDGATCDEVIIVEFTPDGTSTRVDFHHLGIPDDKMSAPAHRSGVDESFDMLEERLAAMR